MATDEVMNQRHECPSREDVHYTCIAWNFFATLKCYMNMRSCNTIVSMRSQREFLRQRRIKYKSNIYVLL